MASQREIVIAPGRPRHHHRRRSSNRWQQHYQDNPATVIELSSHGRRQRGIKNGDDLKSELASQGSRRIVIVRGGWNGVADVLGVALGDVRKSRLGLVRWEYPDNGGAGGDVRDDNRIRSLGVWLEGKVLIVVLGHVSGVLPVSEEEQRQPSASLAAWGIEQALWDSLDDAQPVEDGLAEVVYEKWLSFLDSTVAGFPKGSSSSSLLQPLFWKAMTALERNVDTSRAIQRRGRATHFISPHDWTLLSDRIHRRLQLSLLASGPTNPTAAAAASQRWDKDEINIRSLDRIAYLGGLLLPMTVVSSILAIEGPYGPTGDSFWVFWLAAGISSLVAILVIYADQLRTLDVWIEEAAAGVMEAGLMGEHEWHGAFAKGLDGRLWRRRELGWGGALKKMSGWYKMRENPGLMFRMPR